MIDHHTSIPQSISDSHDEYVQRVAKECSSRNVSDANLRDSCSLNIELKKDNNIEPMHIIIINKHLGKFLRRINLFRIMLQLSNI